MALPLPIQTYLDLLSYHLNIRVTPFLTWREEHVYSQQVCIV